MLYSLEIHPWRLLEWAHSIDPLLSSHSNKYTIPFCISQFSDTMADKPSRALVLYGDGLARFVSPTHTHLHSFATRACCGFLALPNSPPSGKIISLQNSYFGWPSLYFLWRRLGAGMQLRNLMKLF